MAEKRRERRSSFYLKTEISLKEKGRKFGLLRATISFGGIGGYTPDLVDAGSDVAIMIEFPQRSGEIAVEEVSGRVAWAQQDGNFNALGIEFLGLQRDTHPLLFSYLQYLDQFD